ncbi:dolichyl-phosphate-mannose--protein mannosyltransferase [Nocardioides lianchengensis]|uniref:Polyprenol-phosphate-mannose--protein mannosyltransferase n=1 Tax=Nocardioides lianchengensis TaxID=1045774 RepID=A0A1G6Z7A1_9ACTN|nr:phospholipid carrier-dependent glycosyltransferase [Nocardioides lianchengensis]NYG11489.1 dolichyl-phosphate-mannose--protein O-mannosyl transferase [Nocardioides lianchengensis]SDD98518.1 C-terminal four TMM region of protein-O-mannosyltransferase [Nocardioides lianchengensis]
MPTSAPTPARERGAAGEVTGLVVPTAWQRATGRVRGEDPLIGWTASIGIALLALFLRLWRLGSPKEFEFDETYYAKDAWSLLHHGYVRSYVEDANEQILAGQTGGQWKDDPSMVVHPEVGKWLIALGEKAFGMDPFGWRVSAAVAGALMVLVMCRLVRRMTGSTLLGCTAGLLLSLDGLQFVLSRLALLDIFLALFTLMAVTCLVNDRDWFRARLARELTAPVTDGWGPVRAVLWRPWLLAGGVCFGLAIGTKWTALYPLAAFGLLAWLWSAGARRTFGVRWAVLRSAVVDGLPAFGYLVGVGLVVYVATWTGWLVHADQYEEHLSQTQYTTFVSGHCADGDLVVDEKNDDQWPTATEPDAGGLGEVRQSLHSLWNYHQDVFTFHTHFLNCSSHQYASKPSGWLLLNRPVGVAADTGIQPGTRGCDAPAGSDCLRQVLLLGTPTIWWGGIVALLFAVVAWVGGRDWRFGVAVVGTASTWLPWLLYDDRPIFLFYAVVTLPFVVLALTLTMGRLIGPDRVPTRRRTVGVVVSGSFVVLTLLNFAWFWPIFTNGLLTHGEWLDRIWFARWI